MAVKGAPVPLPHMLSMYQSDGWCVGSSPVDIQLSLSPRSLTNGVLQKRPRRLAKAGWTVTLDLGFPAIRQEVTSIATKSHHVRSGWC